MARRSNRRSISRGREPYAPAIFAPPAGLQKSIVVEFRYETPVTAAQGRFVGKEAGEAMADQLNGLIDGMSALAVLPSFIAKPKMIRDALSFASSLPKELKAANVGKRLLRAASALSPEAFFKSNFARVVLKDDVDAHEAAKRLKRQDSVWDAYVAPIPQPPIYFQPPDIAGTGEPFNIEPTQGYLYSAPNGVGACDIWDQAGGKGEGITICDIEGDWNLSHLDFPTGIKDFGGTRIVQDVWTNHGTAVLGVMLAQPNSGGVVGMAHRAKGAVQGAFFGTIFNAAQAIDNAASKLKPGDVILIELHSELHPQTGDYVAMQYFSEVFTAIQSAVNQGIVVVEAAGNGNQNFDAAKYKDTGLQKDAGAIVVGAGVPPSNRVDFNGFGAGMPSYASLGTPRSRMFFSNYGKIVDVQGWGWHVSTTGYGDAAGTTPNEYYTFRFSGTSSASPIVTACAACIQGVAKAKNGAPLTPAEVRKILRDTGTPQADSPGVPVDSNQIGPQPDLVAALKKV